MCNYVVQNILKILFRILFEFYLNFIQIHSKNVFRLLAF